MSKNSDAKSDTQTPAVSKKAFWIGCIMSAVPVLMLIFSAIMKFVQPPPVMEGFKHLGLPENLAVGLGILEIACAVTYAIPRTSVLRAILLTGYFGGATLTHLRVGESVIRPVS